MLILRDTVQYRTIEQCAEIIKEIDPATAITPYFIRGLCKNNITNNLGIDIVPTGNKFLINLSSLFKYLHIEIDENEKG